MLTLIPSTHSSPLRSAMGVLAVLLLAACAAESPPGTEDRTRSESVNLKMLDPPAGPGALAPNLSPESGGVALTWLEPTENGHALRLATLQGESWGPSEPVASGGGSMGRSSSRSRVARLGASKGRRPARAS